MAGLIHHYRRYHHPVMILLLAFSNKPNDSRAALSPHDGRHHLEALISKPDETIKWLAICLFNHFSSTVLAQPAIGRLPALRNIICLQLAAWNNVIFTSAFFINICRRRGDVLWFDIKNLAAFGVKWHFQRHLPTHNLHSSFIALAIMPTRPNVVQSSYYISRGFTTREIITK